MTAADRARAVMVDALRASGRVRSAAVEEALRAVPRHLFLPDVPIAEAYADEAVAVQFADGIATSSASQPSMMSIMLEQLDLRSGHRVLEIGAGTGYNAALMAGIVGATGSVTAVDIDADLIESAAEHLAAAGVHEVELVCADGALGHRPGAPYDRIVLTVGSSDIRPEWVTQLAPGGRLLLPLDVRGSQLSVAFDLGADGLLRSDTVRSCAFIRLRGIGASADVRVTLPDGLSLQVPEDGTAVDAAGLAAALAEPRALVPTSVPLGLADLWDGFGLWSALTEPGACRLLASDPDDLPDELLAAGPVSATLALVSPPGAEAHGLAAVVTTPGRAGTGRRRPVAVRAFGPGGRALAERMLGALDAWVAAGTPGASDWRITAVAAADADPMRTPTSPESVIGPVIVRKQHCRLLMDLPRPLPRR